ncbi:MAG: DUF72 domain-containing protein [Spirochaetaceae bacterium]
MASICVGCAGYSYDDWVGPFYPEGLPKERRLERYAQTFSFVELNFSYYAMPRKEHLATLRKSVPDGFRFSIKAHGSLTHQRRDDWEERAREFSAAITGLEGKLSGVLLQFPYSFHYTESNRRYLADLVEAVAGPELFVEFRNGDWERQQVIEGMRRRELNRVLVDAPKLQGLPGRFEGGEQLPTNRVYLRLHGRNAGNWWSGTNVTRYAYNYSKDELREIAGRLKSLTVPEIFVIFNNHANARAPINALELLKFIEVE